MDDEHHVKNGNRGVRVPVGENSPGETRPPLLGALAQTVERVQEMSIVRQTALGQGREFEPLTPISERRKGFYG